MLLNILQFPDKRLKIKAKRVEVFDAALKKLASDMLETMYETNGAGLAATQVNEHIALIVIDASRDQSEPRIFVNPEIIAEEGHIDREEGCLSFPGIFVKIKRSIKVTVKYEDLDGKEHTLEADDFLAHALQHEIDHIHGITFYDKLSPLKQQMLAKKLEKIRKQSL